MNVPGLAECAHVERVIEAERDDEAAPLAEGLPERAKLGDGLSMRHDLPPLCCLESEVHHADLRAALGEGDDGIRLGRGDLEAGLRRDLDVADLHKDAMDQLVASPKYQLLPSKISPRWRGLCSTGGSSDLDFMR